MSTHEDPYMPRASWAAVYSTHPKSGLTRRLTPYDITDFSLAMSPSSVLTIVASYGASSWFGDVEDLTMNIYFFSTKDGTHRVKVVEQGRWPCWVDDCTTYFHRC